MSRADSADAHVGRQQKQKQQRSYHPSQRSRSPPLDEPSSDEATAVHVPDDDDSIAEKDGTEDELEKLVFGDTAGFRDGLRNVKLDEYGDEGTAASDQKLTRIEDLEDAQLFFTDEGDASFPSGITTKADTEADIEPLRTERPSVWEDSDDERMLVSLATIPRLRKLRRTEGEDVVNGKEYSKRLRRHFETLNGVPEWATQALEKSAKKRKTGSEADLIDDSDEDMDSDHSESVAPISKLLRNAESLVRQPAAHGKKRKLRPGTIDVQRTKDIAGVQPSAITSLSFHPELPLLLSSGPSSTLYLHQIASSPPAPTPNPLLTSLHVRGTQLTTTAFHPSDSRIFLSARRRYFHIWDLHSGKIDKITRVYGHQHEQRSMEHFKLSQDGRFLALLGSSKKGGGVVNILLADTLQWNSQVKIEGRGGIADFCWWRNSKGLTIVGKGGQVTEWSIDENRAVAQWQDEGAVGVTVLTLGGQHEHIKSAIGTDRWIAVGSSSGIVNVYDRRVWLTEPMKDGSVSQLVPIRPTPTRVLDHLTTPTSHLSFSSDGQLLAMASRWKRDSMRLVHMPSCTVYKNWPTSATPLGRITALAFTTGDVVDGGDLHSVLAVANEQGKIRIWEVR